MRSKFEVAAAETASGPLTDDALELLRSIDGKAAIATLLLRQDRLNEAEMLFQDIIADAPSHREAHVSLAAILSDKGETQQAQELLQGFFTRHPVSDPEEGAGNRSLILRVRGFDRTQIMLANGDEGLKPLFRGGHFAIKYLLERSDIALRTFTIANENILKPGAVPNHALMLNTIADPDLEGRSLDALGEWLDRNPQARVINRPERVRETARDINWQRFQQIEGVGFPRTVRLRLAEDRRDAFADSLRTLEFGFPFILREAGTQTARTTTLVRSADEVHQYVRDANAGDHFAIAYHHIQWRGEFFRKLRLFCIEGAFFPVVCHLDRYWNVRGTNRLDIMRPAPDLIDEEKRFLSGWQDYVGSANARRLDEIAELVDLEFFGVDFTLDEKEQLFIYELNPAMRHSFDHAANFPYKLPYDQATTAAFTRMVTRRLPKHDRVATDR